MLDPEVPEDRREEIAGAARSRIESGGTLKHDSSWGMRKLAYEIRQRTEADYRFFRFETGGDVLDDLNHNLRIADGVLRFRIFKVDPRSPAIVPPAPVATTASSRPRRAEQAPPAEEASAEAAEPAEAAEQPEAEAPAEGAEAEAPPAEEQPETDQGGETAEAPAEPEPEPAE